MNLTPREKDKLLIAMAAIVARRRLERGAKLNHPEVVALVSDFIVEGARDGKTVAQLMETGAHVVTRSQTMEGIAELIHNIQVGAWATARRHGDPIRGRAEGLLLSRRCDGEPVRGAK